MGNSWAVVIPSKSKSNLIACLCSIAEHEPGATVYVVDDGVDWESTHKIITLGLDLSIVDGIRPFVFARNVNLGIQAAAPRDVIIMNDDTILETPGGLSRLMATAKNSSYGLVAAATNNVGNLSQQRMTMDSVRKEPRMVCFICVAIPRSTISEVGLLDERFVGYGMDDDDYCLRVRLAGKELAIDDGVFVDHSQLTSSFRSGGSGDYTGNLKIFREKWGYDNWGRK